MRLDQRVALVTGGSRGLGLSIARALAAEGARIAVLARSGEELTRAIATLEAAGASAMAVAADVTRESEVAAAIAAVIRAWDRLDIVVLNAGTWQGAPLHETTEAQWDLLLDLNLKGAFLTLKHALPHFMRRASGTVVGIASFGGWVGQPGSAAYAASKWGLRGLLESAAHPGEPRLPAQHQLRRAHDRARIGGARSQPGTGGCRLAGRLPLHRTRARVDRKRHDLATSRGRRGNHGLDRLPRPRGQIG